MSAPDRKRWPLICFEGLQITPAPHASESNRTELTSHKRGDQKSYSSCSFDCVALQVSNELSQVASKGGGRHAVKKNKRAGQPPQNLRRLVAPDCSQRGEMKRVIAAILFASTSFGALVTLSSGAQASTTSTQKWAVQYVGGIAGPAKSNLSPLTIGVIQPVGVSAGSYPGLGATIQAAGKYVNKQLGGIDGHPLKLDICPVTDSQDGQSCGEQFANNPKIVAVENGVNIFDDTSLLQALAAKPLPVFLPLSITAAELQATNAANYGPGIPAYYPAFVQYLDSKW